MVHALANSLAGKVRVNAISPGWIETRDCKFKRTVASHEDHAQHLRDSRCTSRYRGDGGVFLIHKKPASLLDKNDCRWRHEQTNDLS